MQTLDIPSLLRAGLLRFLLLAALPLGAALIAALVAAIVQGFASIQEQSLSFIPKLFAVILVLALAGGWILQNLGEYTVQIFALIPKAAR